MANREPHATAGNAQAERVRRLFDAAMEVEAGARGSFLAVECEGDAELQAEVQDLLRYASDGEFLKPPAARAQPLRDAEGLDPLIGKTVGAYTIQSIIARGGMGTVYLAEQDSPRRPVAVKIMQVALWSGSAKRRFEYESHILGRLQHANIAQVLEAGTAKLDGESPHEVSYFAMEYVPGGLPITEYAIRNHLGIHERLELFLQVCDGVHHGHQKGVIHRDLKPGNILVGEVVGKSALGDSPGAKRGFVKLIDFGVARCTDSDIAVTTMHTDVGQLIGTLAYMSPEQCEGDPLEIDTRSDVYSLGVVLYELLCGKLPYELTTRSIPRATRTICEDAPVRPSTIDRKLRGDLEILALKALEKDREKRYASVEALAGDIRRYLRGEPIEARRLTMWTRALKWAARHQKAATLIACGVLLISGVAGTFVAVGWFLNLRPDHLIPDLNDRGAIWRVRLVNVLGGTLHEWPKHSNQGIRAVAGALMVDQPASLGGHRLAIVGYTVPAAPLLGALSAYDFSGDWDEVVWEGKIEKDDLPAELVNADEARRGFNVQLLTSANVFPDELSPGTELICTYSHIFSRRCLRIYDLSGKILYQVWQDGSIVEVFWLPSAGTLVCLGLDERVKSAFAKEGVPNTTGYVVFALRPHHDLRSREYVEAPTDERVRPVWYKYLHPVRRIDDQANVLVSAGLTRDLGEYDATRYVGLNVRVRGRDGRLSELALVIDENGEEVRGSRYLDDRWKANRDYLPNPNEFYLSDKPPGPTPTSLPTE